MFNLVHTQTQKRFQKSPLWQEFLEMIVFRDKTSFCVNERLNRVEIYAFLLRVNRALVSLLPLYGTVR